MTILSTLLSPVRYLYYHHLRGRTPRRVGSFEGVATVKKPFGERSGRRPHETALCAGIGDVVEPGDRVVLIGAGAGVSTVHASVMAGQDGRVDVFEASSEQLQRTEQTLSLNLLASPVRLHHAAVGGVRDFSEGRFGAADGDVIAVDNLPDCNVLVIDAEGAEQEILDGLDEWPRAAVVESHGFLGSPTEEVEQRLSDAGYSTKIVGTEDESRDIYIVVGT